MSNAYWISPSGDIIEVDDRHINTIIQSPGHFGLTKKKITDIYRKHGEQFYTEANAREEILKALINKGWIRVRYLPRLYSVTFQLSDTTALGDSWKKRLEVFVKTLWKTIPETVSANIIDLQGETVGARELQIYEIASGALHERRKRGTFAQFLNPRKTKRKKR